MGLREKALSLNSGIEFMQNREKGEIEHLVGQVVDVVNYDFLTDSDTNKEYIVFVIDGDNENFYFGGSVISDKFKEFNEKEKEEIIEFGLPLVFHKRTSKNKREYTDCIFFPSEDDIAKAMEEKGDIPFEKKTEDKSKKQK